MRSLALVVLVVASCAPESRTPPPLQAASDRAAVDIVRRFLDAAKAGDASKVAGHMCGTPADGLARARAALQGPLRIQGYEVAKVEPAWVGAEPYFRVEVTLQRANESDARSLSVRAREGCVDRLLGEPVVGANRPDPGEIAL